MKLTNFQMTLIATVILAISFMCYKGCVYHEKRVLEQAKVEQEKETERTGERWHFLQKVIPWGEDE